MDHVERLNEERRIMRVQAEIERRLGDVEEEASDKKDDLIDIRKHFWDDVKVNFEDAGEAAETYRSMKQQADVLQEKERSYNQMQKQLKTLRKLKQSPYFGRVDFREDGESKAESIYLGIASLPDEDELSFLIYDWRAPVSSLYYDYSPGPACYDTPGGTISGEMTLKRQYMIQGGTLERMFDTGLTIGDDLLQAVLGKQADAQMRSIVATIQKEQNEIIRNERSALLVVQGAAGSGKTSAALQRVAYLLYRYRGSLRADQIVLFSPNTLFNSYVASVLPELGEENMQQTTFQDYLDYRLSGSFAVENPLDQMEYVLTRHDDPDYALRMEAIRFKSSAEFMLVIERYVHDLCLEGIVFNDVVFRGEVMIPAERIRTYFYAMDASIRIPNRMRLVSEWLLQELKAKARLEQGKAWVEEEVELLDKEAYVRAYNRMLSEKRLSGGTFDDFDREQELLAREVVKEWFAPVRAFVRQLRFIDHTAIYRQLFTREKRTGTAAGFEPEQSGTPELPEWSGICVRTVHALDQGKLLCEDATPYLFLKELIEGFQTNPAIRHVLIDEAQDYTPFQFAFIRRMFPRSKMTVLGDVNQAIYAHAGLNPGFQGLQGLFAEGETATVRLTRTYRSTWQIVAFTRLILAEGSEGIVPFNRPGPLPTVTRAANRQELGQRIADRIEKLINAGHQTVAVICKTAQESGEAYLALREYAPVRLIRQDTSAYETGALIIPAYLAKGVEFDAVILYNSSKEQYGREGERKLFYTACTRAMHELHLYYTGEISPLLQAIPRLCIHMDKEKSPAPHE